MKKIFYDYSKVLSYSKALLYFILGERGVGKTYGAIKFCINKFKKRNKKFIYLRRYKTELKESVPHFFDAINANHEFNNKLYSKDNKFYCDDKVCGYAIPLSTAIILKSTSFADVDTIIFDEFIIDKGTYHYLSNEVEQMLDIIETIGRLRDIKVIFLGNAITISNPYFTYFNLTLPYNKDIKTFKHGLIVVNYIKNEEYRKVKRQTKFGMLIKDTNYGKYAIDNEFLRDNKTFIEKRSKASKLIMVLKFNDNFYGVWRDANKEYLYISKDYNPNFRYIYTFDSASHDYFTILTRFKTNSFLSTIMAHYKLALLRFDNQKIKNTFMKFIDKYLY